MRFNERLTFRGLPKENNQDGKLRRRTIEGVVPTCHLHGSSSERLIAEGYVVDDDKEVELLFLGQNTH